MRYIGSRVATLLSVGLSNLFGMPQLAQEEKKTLVFADSVQNAAHRAGFVQSRSRGFGIRTLMRSVVGDEDVAVAQMPLRILERADAAEDTAARAFRAAAAEDRGRAHVRAVLVQGRGRERPERSHPCGAAAPGTGRGAGVRAARAPAAIMQTQAIDGQLFWPTMSAVGAEMLNVRVERDGQREFNHVVVDEAQDFNAGHWRFLRACVASGPNDIFIAEDSHQRIYGNPLTLSHFGISTRGRASRRLTLNYRTTKENLDYALRILVGGDMEFLDGEGEVDSVGGYRSARTGPAPMIVTAASEDEEFAVAAALINGWLGEAERSAAEGVNKEARVGVMCRTRGQLSRVVSGLADHGIDAVQTKNAELASHEQVSVMTMHGAKGMEFTHVILMGVGKEIMPLRFRLKNLSEEDARAALQRERSRCTWRPPAPATRW